MVLHGIQNNILAFITSMALTLLLIPRFARVARKVGLVDMPAKRKVHSDPIPLIGGIVIMMAVAITCLTFVPLEGFRGLYAGLFLLTLVGLLDDFKEINHKVRLLVQMLAVVFMVYYSDTRLLTFGDLLGFGDINFGVFSVLATIFTIIGVINAINLIDGLDALAGGVSFICFSAFGVLCLLNGQSALLTLILCFLGAILGFLWYNRPPARVFMGDAGSIAIGFALGYLSIAVTHYSGGIAPSVCALLILAVPITDTIIVMSIRVAKRKSPFSPDRGHMHHMLIRFGYSKVQAIAILLALTAAFSIFSVYGAVHDTSEPLMFLVYLVFFALCGLVALNIKRLYRARLSGRLPLPGAASRQLPLSLKTS